MNMNPDYLIASLLLGGVGTFYLLLGKRKQQALMRGCGLGLIVCPLVLDRLPVLLAVGLLLCALPPLVNRYY